MYNGTRLQQKAVIHMQRTVVPSQYLQIARDLAGRIARGELEEGSRIYGRSVMASEYSVSPETIRRANLPKQQEGGKKEPSKPE